MTNKERGQQKRALTVKIKQLTKQLHDLIDVDGDARSITKLFNRIDALEYVWHQFNSGALYREGEA